MEILEDVKAFGCPDLRKEVPAEGQWAMAQDIATLRGVLLLVFDGDMDAAVDGRRIMSGPHRMRVGDDAIVRMARMSEEVRRGAQRFFDDELGRQNRSRFHGVELDDFSQLKVQEF